MSFNVPDDWGAYTARCERCCRSYHMSEGCDCWDDLPGCQCGKCLWNPIGSHPRCTKCGTGPAEVTKTVTRIHTARKAYGSIQPGDRYRKRTEFGFWPNGPRFIQVSHQPLMRASRM